MCQLSVTHKDHANDEHTDTHHLVLCSVTIYSVASFNLVVTVMQGSM